MMSKNKVVILSLSLVLSFGFAISQVVETHGESVEFVGLKQWTIEQIRDSLRRVAPEEELGQCAIPLKYKLHFPEVSVEWATHPSDKNKRYTIVTVIEPQNSMYVNRQTCYSSPYSLIQEWREFKDRYSRNRYERMLALRYQFLDSIQARAEVEKMGADAGIFSAIVNSLSHLTVQVSKMVRLVTESYEPDTRQIAIMALGTHPENDSSWYALIRALRDISDVNATFAGIALTSFADNSHRAIDWKPVYADLESLFNGTNLFVYINLLKLFSQVGYTSADLGRYSRQNTHVNSLLLS